MSFKIGDKVRVKKDVVSMYSEHEGTITSKGGTGYDWRVQFSDGQLPLNSYELELVEVTRKFKVGDRVVVSTNLTGRNGKKGVVKVVNPSWRTFPYEVHFDEDTDKPNYCVLLQEDELALVVFEPKFKVGDKVWVPKLTNSVWRGQGVVVNEADVDAFMGEYATIEMATGEMQGEQGSFSESKLEAYVEPKFVPKFKKGDLVEVDYVEDSDWNGKAVVTLAAEYAKDSTIVEPLQGEYKGIGGAFFDWHLKPYVEPVTFKVGDLVEILPSAPGRIGEFGRIFEVSPSYSWRVRFPNGVILAVFESEISH